MRHIVLLLAVAGTLYAQAALDGSWWKRANQDTRTGVIWGISDCLEADRGIKLANYSAPEAAQAIDNYYLTNPADTPLQTAIQHVPQSRLKRPPGGEHFAGKHKWWDGDYWEVGLSEDEGKGFVLGYVSCSTGSVPSPAKVNTILKKSHQWYESHPKRMETAVADVFERIGVVPSHSTKK